MAAESFKFSADPKLEAKLTDVVGLYLHPPENAVVVAVMCVDEKSQIQALDRAQLSAYDLTSRVGYDLASGALGASCLVRCEVVITLRLVSRQVDEAEG